jgi:hypothetical protein
LPRPFRVRSPQRDVQTDRERIGSVLQAINTAVASARSERDALHARVSEARDLASFAVGTGSDEYLTREARDKSRIAEYEQQMIVGEKRITDLDTQIAGLMALQELAGRLFP